MEVHRIKSFNKSANDISSVNQLVHITLHTGQQKNGIWELNFAYLG